MSLRTYLGALFLLAALGAGAVAFWNLRQRSALRSSPQAIEAFCTSCHLYPPPDTLPRDRWRSEIETMYAIAGESAPERRSPAPDIEAAVRYYTERAPSILPPSPSTVAMGPGKLRTERISIKLEGAPPFAGTANVRFVTLFDDTRLDLLISEMRFGMVIAIRPYIDVSTTVLLGRVPHPCHAEVVDLDRDGARDVLVANLGTITPSDALDGSVVWLRREGGGAFSTHTIIGGRGRVADAQAADFDGDGDMDIVAAVFGWRKVGEILFLENRSPARGVPDFVPSVIDARPGAIHVPIADLNGDGRPDFVALISQHFESVVAYLNRGGGSFDPKTIFTAPHPNWGSSGIDLVDLDTDGDLDVLLANGDTLDDLILKPYHGLSWLENTGGYPWTSRRLTEYHGAHLGRAGDFDLDGDLDIVAGSFLPFLKPGQPGTDLAEGMIWLEQVERGRFERRSLEPVTCVHPTLDVGDYDADGDPDIVAGNMTMAKGEQDRMEVWAVILRNLVRP